jgi:RNA recognition motif-containing protein
VHFDPPADHKDYLHRSGRTARAGAGGSVITLVTRDQQKAVRGLQRNLGMSAPIGRPEPGSLADGGHRMGDEPSADEAPTDTDSQGVYVANLPWSTTSDQLAELFAPHGEVLGATIVTDRRTGRSRGFGFVDMVPADATTAIGALSGSRFGGRPLTVRAARPRR